AQPATLKQTILPHSRVAVPEPARRPVKMPACSRDERPLRSDCGRKINTNQNGSSVPKNETAYMIALSSRGGPPSFFLSFTDGALAPADLSARSKSRAGQSSAPRRRRKGEGRNGEPARAAVHQGGRVSATGGVSLDGPRARARRNARRASGEVERSRGAFALLFV